MALEIFKLVGSIFVDNDKANESISKTDEKAEGLGNKLLSGVGTAAKWGAAIVTATTGAATAMVGMASSVASTADDIDEMSNKIGISRQTYQELDYVLGLNGASVDSMKNGIKTLTAQMDKASSGNKGAIEQFEKLGVSVLDANGELRNQEDVMFEVMNALQGIENQTEKSRVATELFGKAGLDLMPTLNGAAGSIDEMRKEAHDLGLVMSDDAIDSAVEMQDTFDKLQSSFSAVSNKLSLAVLPIVQKFANLLLDYMPTIQGLVEKLAPVLIGMLEKMLPPLMEMIEKLLPILVDLIISILPLIVDIASTILPIIIDLLMMILPPLIELISAVLPPLVAIIQALLPILTLAIDLLKPILDLFINLLQPIIELITSAITPLITILAELITMVLEPLIPIIEIVAKILTGVLGVAFKQIGTYVQMVVGIFKGLIDFIKNVFTGNWKGAFEAVKSIVKNIFDSMVNIVKAPINFIIKGINSFIGGLNKLKIPDWVPGVGGKGINIPLIPQLAKGGVLDAGQMFIANEAGPELVGNVGNKTAVVNNAQILDILTAGVYKAVKEAMSGFTEQITAAIKENDSGDITIILQMGSKIIEEFIITAKERINYKSGGYANV